MVAESESLDQLQSPEQVALLDAIDKLRCQGLGHYDISLPQLIVCGDQSSGKSSVLEGLTRLRFPTKDGLCTTFATELVLRKHVVVEISCSIIPGKTRSKAERDELSKFRRCYASREDFAFPTLLEEARECMAFGIKSTSGLFFEDVLQIRYSGPDLPSLTFVDLPGIIHAEIKGNKGVETVRRLVQSYMSDERSIILAVVSAKSDPQTQGILNYVKELDPKASRTLGIITKPDTLEVNSEGEDTFLKMARNEAVSLHLGWHVVKNRNFAGRDLTDAERDHSEKQFFSTGVWNSLPPGNVGIETLRSKLSRVLLQHIRKELPSLSATIQDAIEATESSLKTLGNPRDDQQQQRNYLMTKAQRFGTLTREALQGVYSDPFFKADSSSGIIPPTRLRTQILELNLAFALAMYSKGHQYHIIDRNTPTSVPESYDQSSMALQNYDDLPEPIIIEKAEYLEKEIYAEVRISRATALYSLEVNPGVIREVFRQQAKPWKAVAQRHLKDVYDVVLEYLNESLGSTMDQETLNALMQEHIEPEMEKRQQRLSQKLNELLVPYQKQEPAMYNPRMPQCFEPRKEFAFGGKKSGKMQPLANQMDNLTESISVFINNVAALAIENCLITDLSSLLSPELVLNMDEEKLAVIASESEDVRIERAALRQKLEDLKAGKRVLDLQARRSGKVTRNALRPLRAVSNIQTPDARPNTPTQETEVDHLTSSFTRINVTPPPPQFWGKGAPLTQGTPVTFTPPKSPKAAEGKPPPRWKMRARVDDGSDSDAEYGF
ncbi:P-loop containing nucleoside triphosphate hydrolase protein [Massarina eburnea CBS 473.64]|uniref:P-loop containing nucleoside triphosphate hydrolase protein n=1 Tax=Massarina eburnea CBS 473.64 TaxID=1395130 RepID=A0A6A6RIL7_9PLEO|nr:P-loop containing nucleoside triphosphate hydrolase protein [Massarina eburnea CBS 473.64]